MPVCIATGRFPLSEYEGVVLQRLVGGCYTPGMAPLLQTSSEAFKLLVQLLGTSSHTTQTTPPPQELATMQVLVWMMLCSRCCVHNQWGCLCVSCVQVTPEFFAGLPSPDARQEVLQCLINMLLESQRSKVVTMVKEQVVKVSVWANKVVYMHQVE